MADSSLSGFRINTTFTEYNPTKADLHPLVIIYDEYYLRWAAHK